MPIQPGYREILGSERPQASGAELVAPVAADELVEFTILLRPRPGSPDLHPAEHWQDTPPESRSYLSVDEFLQTYGAADEELQAVSEFAESAGLQVIEADAGRRRVVVEGPAASVNSAFGITLNQYRVPLRAGPRPLPGSAPATPEQQAPTEQIHRGFEGPVQVPAALADAIAAVIGLDNRRLGGPAGNGTGDPPDSNYLLATTIAQYYNFPTTGAAGQTIGVFAAADQNAAYSPTDIAYFISHLPEGHNTQPHLFPIGLRVDGTQYDNDPSKVSVHNGAAVEISQDIETAAAIGQGANINVYFTADSEAGWEAFLSRAVFPQAGDHDPSVLTASWLLELSDDEGTIGNPLASGSIANVLSSHLQAAAMRGITVFMAIGDWGAADQLKDGQCHVSYPNSDPWVTACGGTIIGDVNPGPPARFDEWVWSDANHPNSPFYLPNPPFPPFTTTGGGVSATFPVPSYQTAAGVAPVSKNDGRTRRGVPDVAGMVGIQNMRVANTTTNFAGTSAVAPLYAGLTAVVNASLGQNVGFLNPTLYQSGSQICNDITHGNNDSGYTPDSPFYEASPGWDACTGWGSIDGGRLLAAVSPTIETAIADSGDFGTTCVGSFVDETLTINNTGASTLKISSITSSSPAFEVPSVVSYPLTVNPGESITVVIRFQPTTVGPQSAVVTIHANTPSGTRTVSVSGTAGSGHLVLAIADAGDFGSVCVGSFRDEPLIVNNSGSCPLSVTAITSSDTDFSPPTVESYPVLIAPGAALGVPIRFAPACFGAKTATLTVDSDDPDGPKTISVSGNAPAGKLAVTGSAYFGEVDFGFAERVINVCNVGECPLHVTGVAFSRPRRHFRLLDNPFPATLVPGSSLAVVIKYEASCDPECCELVIHSDDPTDPVRVLDVVAFTRCRPLRDGFPGPQVEWEPWRDCGCGRPWRDCGCEPRRHGRGPEPHRHGERPGQGENVGHAPTRSPASRPGPD